MSKLLLILRGWFNFYFRKVNVEKIAKTRIEICSKCPHSRFYNPIEEWEYTELGIPTKPNAKYCSKCSNCPISKKARSLKEKCPDHRW